MAWLQQLAPDRTMKLLVTKYIQIHKGSLVRLTVVFTHTHNKQLRRRREEKPRGSRTKEHVEPAHRVHLSKSGAQLLRTHPGKDRETVYVELIPKNVECRMSRMVRKSP